MLQNSCCLIWEQKMGQTGSLPWQSASNLALLPQEYAYPPAPPPDPKTVPKKLFLRFAPRARA